MNEDTFAEALDFTARAERLAWSRGAPKRVLLSGGECTEHPHIASLIAAVRARRWEVVLITNGYWMADPDLRRSLLRPEWTDVRFQVTHDPEFYPLPLTHRVDDPRIVYVERLAVLLPLGRIARKAGPHGIPNRQAPSSFNLRSMGRVMTFEEAVAELRLRTMGGKAGHCIPSVADDGRVMAGESRLCWVIGTVRSTMKELTEALRAMGTCNRCGLEENLDDAHREALGLPRRAPSGAP